jgi:hypothetical protein
MTWTKRDNLQFDIAFGLGKGAKLLHGLRRQLSEEDRKTIAKVILDHLERSNWRFERGPVTAGFYVPQKEE